MHELKLKGGARATSVENTTLAVVVTDASLTKAQAKRLAIVAQSGFARAINPVHAPLDGDVVFAAATGKKAVDGPVNMTELGMLRCKRRPHGRSLAASMRQEPCPFLAARRLGKTGSDADARGRREPA